jgi:hypothetical protein
VKVEGPVGAEVVVGGEGAEAEDGFGSFEAPAGAGDVEQDVDGDVAALGLGVDEAELVVGAVD